MPKMTLTEAEQVLGICRNEDCMSEHCLAYRVIKRHILKKEREIARLKTRETARFKGGLKGKTKPCPTCGTPCIVGIADEDGMHYYIPRSEEDKYE
jgi:hypothetical protein